MRSKSATLEGASTQHLDQEANEEMQEVSTQGMGLHEHFAISLVT